MTYVYWDESWDLSSIPEDAFLSELGRRNNARRKHKRGGATRTCNCGKCAKCRMRIYQAKRRKESKQQ